MPLPNPRELFRRLRTRARRKRVSLAVLLLVILAYNIALSAPVVHRVLVGLAPQDARLQLDVKRGSLLFGFEFEKVLLVDQISGDPIFRADRVSLKWFLPGVLAGQIGIRELALTNPVVSLIKRNGRWNTAAFGTSKKEPEKPSSPINEIELFLPLRIYGALHIEGLQVLIDEQGPERFRRLHISDVDLHVGLITRTFHRIPINLGLVDLVDSLVVAVNPVRRFQFEYEEIDRISGKPLAILKLYKETIAGDTAFVSRLRVETGDLALTTPAGLRMPFDITLRYDVFYDPLKQRVVLRDLRLLCGPDVWLSLAGDFFRDEEGFHHVDLQIRESKIQLDRVAPLVARLTGGHVQLGGYLSLYPFTLQGRLDRLSAHVGASAAGLLLQTTKSRHFVSTAQIDLSATVDLYSIGVFPPPSAYRTDPSIAYGILREARIDRLDLGYNGAMLNAHGSLQPSKGIELNAKLMGFEIGQFTAPFLLGSAGADVFVHSGTDFRRITVQGGVTLDGGRYRLDRSMSGGHNLRLDADLDIEFPEKSVELQIRRAYLTGHDSSGQRLATILAGGHLVFGGGQRISAEVQNLDLDYAKLYPLLPGNLRTSLVPARAYLEKGVILSGRAEVAFRDHQGNIQGDLNLVLPSISQDGLHLHADLGTAPGSIQLRQIQLSGLRGALNASLSGSLLTSDEAKVPNLDFRLNLSRQGMLPVHENVSLDGSVDLVASIRPDRVDGSVDIRRLNVIYSNRGCTQGSAPCTQYHLEDLNLALPFHHDMHPAPVRYETMLNPDLLERFPDRPNLTLRSLWSNRSPDGLVVNPGFYFLGAPSPQARAALESSVRYYKNIVESRQFQLSTYRLLKEGESSSSQAIAFSRPGGQVVKYVSNGTVEVRNLFFNLADLRLENMEYGAHMTVHDLNVEPYFPRADSSYDGIVSAAAQVRGENLIDPVRNMNARLSVYRISKDFTGFAVRIMMPSDILARMVNNTLIIPSLGVELRGGLVYTMIQVSSPGLLSFSHVIRPKEETIRQERIPLAEFLERTRKETGELNQ